MEIFNTVLITLCYFVFVTSSTVFEAYSFHMKDYDKKQPFNPHLPLTVMRMSFFVVAAYWTTYWMIIPYMLMFPFIHDGLLYKVRNELFSNVRPLVESKLYPKGFFHNPSKHNCNKFKAIMSFSFVVRTLMFIVGAVVMVFIML